MNGQVDLLYSLAEILTNIFVDVSYRYFYGFVRELLIFELADMGHSEKGIPTSPLMWLMSRRLSAR